MRMRRLNLAISCAAFLSTFLLSTALAHPTPDTAAQIQASPLQQSLVAAQVAFYDATRNKDVAYIKRVVTDDFVLIKTNGEAADRQALIDDARTGSEQPRMYNVQAISLGESAAILSFDAIFADKPRYQHITSTWVKRGDQWMLRFQQITPNIFSLGD